MLNDNFAVEQKTVTSLKPALILSGLCLLLMIIQAIIGLFVPGTYIKDGAAGKATWQGNDFVNLFLFAPLLFIALVFIRRGSDKGKLFWLGIQALITYDYIYYPLGVAYDRYFLLYVAILGISLYSFLFGITRIDFSKYEHYIPEKRSSITASVLMLVFSLILSTMWIGLSIYYIFTGEIKLAPQGMITTFDLLLIVTPVVLSVIWLLKGQARGYVILTMMAMASGFYCFILIAYTPFALKANLPDAWTLLPLWIILCVLCLPTMIILLRSQRRG